MDYSTPNQCLWNSLGLYQPIDTEQNFRITRSKVKPVLTPLTKDFNENDVRSEETNNETCFTEIKKPTKKSRRDSLHVIQLKNDGNEQSKKRKKPSKDGSKSKKLKSQALVEEDDDQMLSDVYHNRLWRQQMPVSRKLETIPEEKVMKPDSSMRFRFIEFSDLVSLKKIKRRQQLAARNGWKKTTKKRLNELDKILNGYMEKLNSE